MKARSLLSLLLAVISAPLAAVDFVVTRYDDPVPDGCIANDCSLREAVIAANVDDAADRVLLSAGVYFVDRAGAGEDLSATGDLDPKKDLEIVGVGAGITILDGTGLGEGVLDVFGAADLDFALRAVTVRNSPSSAIRFRTGTHTLEDCEFRNNGTTTGHHGIDTNIGTVITLRRVLSFGNAGAGLFATQSSVNIENSTFSSNGFREISVSTGVSFTCTHCTVSDPSDSDPEVFVLNSTATFVNSIVSGNCSAGTGGIFLSEGGNVESPSDFCNFVQPADQNTVSAFALELGALADNGGPTATHLPGATSAATTGDAVDADCLDVVTDQRGVARAADCDSGAVERTSAHVETPIFHDGFVQGDAEAWSDAIGD